MIFEFTYTECTSAGPFKKETGYKVKSARIYKLSTTSPEQDDSIFTAFDSENSEGGTVQETLDELVEHQSKLDTATTHLSGFNAPPIGPFSTPEEFAAIPKGFIYDLVRLPDGKLAWLLARLSTSGPAYGRPGNPFHQGILIMNRSAKAGLLRHANQHSELHSPRPIDMLTWAGWLNPRGDVQVDASHLRASNLPFPEISPEEMSVLHGQFVSERFEKALDVFSGVSRSFMRGSPVPIPGQDSEEFRDWVSVVSQLIPSSVSWFCGFGSTWKSPAQTLEGVGLPQFYWSNSQPQESSDVESWAFAASKVFEHDLDLLVYDSINQIDQAFSWTREDHTSYALIPLALAVLGLSVGDLGEDEMEVANECASLLQRVQWPMYRGESTLFENLWEMLEAPDSLFNTLADRGQLERKLDNLLPPKENA